jgi:hypothetical protein
MAGISFNSFLSQIATGDTVKDYQHASKLFVDGLYRLSPKYTFLFHVYIDVNPVAASLIQGYNSDENIELGMLAKSAQLPKFNIKNKTYNAYNRKNIVQDSINYEPITITFHDDSADIVTGFWGNYYTYYYRDGDYQESAYLQSHKYTQRQFRDWGFSPVGEEPFLSSIRIYSLHQKYFTAYTLLNPMITSFRHGEHQYGQNETMQHEMTVAYEGIHYMTGAVADGTVKGFNVIHYDNVPSPLSPYGGGTKSLLGPGGLMNAAGSALTNLSNGNFLAAAVIGARAANNFNNVNLSTIANAEFSQIGMNILKGQNQQATIFAPTASSIASSVTQAVFPSPKQMNIAPGAVININNQNSLR